MRLSKEIEKLPRSADAQQRAHPKKQRLDLLLVERELVENSEQAKRLIMAGEVLVGTERIDKPGFLTPVAADITLRTSPQFVSRGGLKLSAAIEHFQIDVAERIAVDVGASTGGFTDCLLQKGIKQVFAVDVGYGHLAWKVRSDPRVVPIERTNIRYLESLPNGTRADLAVIDASFISLKLVLPATVRLLKPDAQIIALIKPQFEAAPAQIDQGGVVRDAQVHRSVLEEILDFANSHQLRVLNLMVPPAPCPAGNIEFLFWLGMAQFQSSPALFTSSQMTQDGQDWTAIIDQALAQATLLRK